MLEHGGNLRAASIQFDRPLSDWLDLSTGLNPHGYPAPEVGAAAWHRLPERDPLLVQAASRYYGAPHMLAVAGSQAAIQALPRLRPPSRVVVAAPSYAEHAHHWNQHGHSTREAPHALLDATVSDCEVLVVCNPNNPTGHTVPRERLLSWRARLAERGGWLVVDEAFADVARADSVADMAALPGLIVLCSVGKFFGLAGLRVGFVGAEPGLLDQLDKLLGPWTVSGPAQLVARAALDDLAWQSRTRERLAADHARLGALLRECHLAASGTALFQWWPMDDPEPMWQHLAERGIWTRLFRHGARGIRIGLPPDEPGWQRLITTLNEWKDRS